MQSKEFLSTLDFCKYISLGLHRTFPFLLVDNLIAGQFPQWAASLILLQINIVRPLLRFDQLTFINPKAHFYLFHLFVNLANKYPLKPNNKDILKQERDILYITNRVMFSKNELNIPQVLKLNRKCPLEFRFIASMAMWMSQNHQKIQIPRILNSLTPRFAHSEVTCDFASLKYNWQIAVAEMIICKTIKKNKPCRIILKETMP
jgi:hypothetical protein